MSSAYWRAANWFHGPISKEEANARLKISGDGSFLVRETPKPGVLVLQVEAGGAPTSFTISLSEGDKCTLGTNSFPSPMHLITQLQKTPIRAGEKICAFKRAASKGTEGLAPPANGAFGTRTKSTATRAGQGQVKAGHAQSSTLPRGQRLAAEPLKMSPKGSPKAARKAAARSPKASPKAARKTAPTNAGPNTMVTLHMKRAVNEVFDVFIKSTEAGSAYRHEVDGVEEASFAGRAGLSAGDVIVGIGGRDATRLSGPDLWNLLDHQGTSFDVGVQRAGAASDARPTSIRRRSSLLTVEDSAASSAVEPSAANVETEDLSCCIAPLDMQAYNDLDYRKVPPKDVPVYGRGTKLNRYFDILPSPLTRVVLPEIDNDPQTTYINANFVRGYGGKSAKEYIAAQGPLPATVNAFIRMIWHRGVRVIVMVTGFVEKGKPKCERYFPETPESKPLVFGDITVRTERIVKGSAFNTNSLVLTKGKETLRVEHVWYHAWPDHGVPTNAKGEMNAADVIDLLQHVQHLRDAADGGTSSLLVHCSAGVGRTGTFIVIDHVMNAIKARNEVDIIRLIEEIREDRMALVQHLAQYRFAYQACISYAKTHIVDTLGGEIYALATPDMSPSARKSINRQASWKTKRSGGTTVLTLDTSAPGLKQTKEDLIAEEDEEQQGSQPTSATRDEDVDAPTASDAEKSRELSLEKQPWFRKRFSREQVAQTLEEQPEGTFLVRPSSKPGFYTMSVVIGPHRLHNYLIAPTKLGDGSSGYMLGTKGQSKPYKSVIELVLAYVGFGKLAGSVDDQGEAVQIVKGASGGDDYDFEC
eukprot:m.11809 g.11809  ORF g.11809 m.11809 type:complete len:814 (+) comp4473_c0_seq2:296-2737(+)